MRQISFQKIDWDHRYSHGGKLRQLRAGRHERPISTKDPIHLVFKANRETIPGGFRTPRRFRLIHQLRDRYAKRFFIKVEKIAVAGDHIHLAIRVTRRGGFQNFLRVFSGQVVQQFGRRELVKQVHRRLELNHVTDTPTRGNRETQPKSRLWKYRPFTRVVKGYRAYLTMLAYVELNEQEASGKIAYQPNRLKELPKDEWRALWS